MERLANFFPLWFGKVICTHWIHHSTVEWEVDSWHAACD